MNDRLYKCKKCSNDLMYLKENGPHIGLYCSAGHFIAWINKKTIQANTEQVSDTMNEEQTSFTEDTNDDLPWNN